MITRTRPAKGLRGHLIYSSDGDYYFRVYDKDHNFVDYAVRHSDLTVIIDDDDATLYEDEFSTRLDHSPATLGIKEWKLYWNVLAGLHKRNLHL
jgi:hypothetical protein